LKLDWTGVQFPPPPLNGIEIMDLDLSDKRNTYVYPLIEDVEVGQLITTGKHILEVIEIDRSQQLMIVQKVI